MRLSVQYMAQLRWLVGRNEEQVVLPAGSSLDQLLDHVAKHQQEAAVHLLSSSGQMRPSLLVALNGRAVAAQDAATTTLAEGDIVTLLPPIAGG